jgi:hypothetical protein
MNRYPEDLSAAASPQAANDSSTTSDDSPREISSR